MPQDDRHERIEVIRRQVHEHDIDRWIQDQLDDLAEIVGEDAGGAAVSRRPPGRVLVEPVSRAGGMEEGPEAVAAALGRRRRRRARGVRSGRAAGAGACRRAARAERRRRALRRGPLALLGECTLAPAVAGALQRRYADLALVWLDAHGDLNTPETSPCGFLGGMPFAILLGWCHPELAARPAAAGERAALVGGRDLDPGERGDRAHRPGRGRPTSRARWPRCRRTPRCGSTSTGTCSTRPTRRASTSPRPAAGRRPAGRRDARCSPPPAAWSASASAAATRGAIRPPAAAAYAAALVPLLDA